MWFVSDGERLLALTDRHSPKVRRMRRDPHVLVASCRAGGKLRGEPVPARAQVLTATPDLERVRRLLLDRYPLSYRLVMAIYRLGRGLRRKPGVADGAALAITVGGEAPIAGASIDDGTHTPPHGDPLLAGEGVVDARGRRARADMPPAAV